MEGGEAVASLDGARDPALFRARSPHLQRMLLPTQLTRPPAILGRSRRGIGAAAAATIASSPRQHDKRPAQHDELSNGKPAASIGAAAQQPRSMPASFHSPPGTSQWHRLLPMPACAACLHRTYVPASLACACHLPARRRRRHRLTLFLPSIVPSIFLPSLPSIASPCMPLPPPRTEMQLTMNK